MPVCTPTRPRAPQDSGAPRPERVSRAQLDGQPGDRTQGRGGVPPAAGQGRRRIAALPARTPPSPARVPAAHMRCPRMPTLGGRPTSGQREGCGARPLRAPPRLPRAACAAARSKKRRGSAGGAGGGAGGAGGGARTRWASAPGAASAPQRTARSPSACAGRTSPPSLTSRSFLEGQRTVQTNHPYSTNSFKGFNTLHGFGRLFWPRWWPRSCWPARRARRFPTGRWCPRVPARVCRRPWCTRSCPVALSAAEGGRRRPMQR